MWSGPQEELAELKNRQMMAQAATTAQVFEQQKARGSAKRSLGTALMGKSGGNRPVRAFPEAGMAEGTPVGITPDRMFPVAGGFEGIDSYPTRGNTAAAAAALFPFHSRRSL